jgi:hypothetical protein
MGDIGFVGLYNIYVGGDWANTRSTLPQYVQKTFYPRCDHSSFYGEMSGRQVKHLAITATTLIGDMGEAIDSNGCS